MEERVNEELEAEAERKFRQGERFKEVFQRMTEIKVPTKFHEAALQILVHRCLPISEFLDLQELFLSLLKDTNHSGKLTFDELFEGFLKYEKSGFKSELPPEEREVAKRLYFKKVFARINLSNSGKVSWSEFMIVGADKKVLLTDSILQECFS